VKVIWGVGGRVSRQVEEVARQTPVEGGRVGGRQRVFRFAALFGVVFSIVVCSLKVRHQRLSAEPPSAVVPTSSPPSGRNTALRGGGTVLQAPAWRPRCVHAARRV